MKAQSIYPNNMLRLDVLNKGWLWIGIKITIAKLVIKSAGIISPYIGFTWFSSGKIDDIKITV